MNKNIENKLDDLGVEMNNGRQGNKEVYAYDFDPKNPICPCCGKRLKVIHKNNGVALVISCLLLSLKGCRLGLPLTTTTSMLYIKVSLWGDIRRWLKRYWQVSM